uniref:Uncharacterized protein n=1 Tax=Triticum urartu TaxID=4572 RepID=A0A8R7QVR7_TRIUA
MKKKELVVTRAAGTGADRDSSPINGTRWSQSSRSHQTRAQTVAATSTATAISLCRAAALPPAADRPASLGALLQPGRPPAASFPARTAEPSCRWRRCRGRCRPAMHSGWRRPAPCPYSIGDGDDSGSSSGGRRFLARRLCDFA